MSTTTHPHVAHPATTQHHSQHNNHSRNVIESVIKNFDSLISATSVKSVLENIRNISKLLHYDDDYGLCNFYKLKNALNVKSLSKWNRVSSILKTLDAKSNQKEYTSVRSKIQGKRILVIGGGISGLRASIELLLLGAKVICVEKRDEFTRNNVIHLWPNVIHDMYSFEAKRFYGQFCVGSIDHVSIRQLQLILLKIAIIYGLKFYPNTTFKEICPRTTEPREFKCNGQSCDCCCHVHGFGGGAYAHFSTDENYPNLNKQSFDIIIGCDGRRNTFSRYFPRNNRRGKLAIGLTANFVNHRTEEEAHCPEISGISRIYNQKWFKDLQDETDIELENLVYYRDETHYFVMTATKASLLKRGVLKRDFGDSHQLLHLDNIDTMKLIRYSKDAAEWSSKLKRLEFARNSNNMPDVALFDFTSMYSATNASCAKKIYLKCCDKSTIINNGYSKYMLVLLCGDSLLEPFWPTGSGAGRGFLSALDAAWAVSQWFSHVSDESNNIDSMLNVISRREYVYRLLAQTSPENTSSKNFTLDPQTRYKNLNILNYKTLQEIKAQVQNLIIDKTDLDVRTYRTSYESKRARRATVGIDPQDVLKAKNLMVKSDLDECHPIGSVGGGSPHLNYHHKQLLCSPVPSSNINDALSKSLCCDNKSPTTIPEVINLKPKNFDNTKRHVDVQPRNNDSANLVKKNHHARNHFFNTEFEPTTKSSSTYNNNNQFSTSTMVNNCTNDKFFSSHQPCNDRSNKENFPIPDFKHMFDLDIGDLHNNNTRTTKTTTTTNISNSLKDNIYHSANSLKSRFNNDSKSHLSLHDFEKSLNRKPKKSSDIMEKAQHLAQKFEELNKPYVPSLVKVGKIEENDWNVKIWNSNDIFAPKVEKKNLVNENSKDLLQSRIMQYHNNVEYKKELPKTLAETKMSNEYVNLLTNEVCQKLINVPAGSNTADVMTKSVEVPKSSFKMDSLDSGHSFKVDSTKKSEFLKPIGDCKRCQKTLLAIDRVNISGQQFHKNCLTCKSCSVTLRQDEINEDFTCKICIKSRTRMLSNESKNSFLNNSSLNLSLIEAKKNFLVNVEQIDLRERAEFEIMENESESETSKTNINDDGDNNEQQETNQNNYYNGNFNCDDENEANNEESSELTESEVHCSSDTNNYTDDENSDSEDFPSNANQKDEEYGSGFTSLIGATTVDSDALADDSTCDSANAVELVESYDDLLTCDHSDAYTKQPFPTPNDEDFNKIIEDDLITASIIDADCSFRNDLETHSMPSCHLVDINDRINNDNTNNFNRDSIDHREKSSITITEAIQPIVETTTIEQQQKKVERPTSAVTNITTSILEAKIPVINATFNNKSTGATINKPSFLPTYKGKFTEKFYRSLSQPSLHDQLNLIDDRLRKKREPSTQALLQDLPFADGENQTTMAIDQSSKIPVSNQTTTKTKFTHTPFARSDHV